jgi:hypothetical protein
MKLGSQPQFRGHHTEGEALLLIEAVPERERGGGKMEGGGERGKTGLEAGVGSRQAS